MRVRSVKFKLLTLLSFALLGGTPRFAHGLTVRSCFETHLPAFIQALDSSLTQKQQTAFLDGWTKRECFRLVESWRFIDDRMAKEHGRSPEALFQTHGNTMLGVLGELYGTGYLRKVYDYESGARVLDEADYNALNRSGSSPDGLVYQIQEGRLTLLRVMESKLGTETYRESQGAAYLKRWSTRGIAVPWKESSWHFSPELISLGSLPLVEADIQDLRNLTLLVGSRARTFEGGTLQTPLSATELRELILHFLTHQLEKVPLKSEQPKTAPPPAPKPISHRTPLLTDAEVPNFKKALADFFYERGHWPKGGSECALERYLAKKISAMGGQSTAFIHYLTGAERHFLTEIGQIPASGSLGATLIRQKPHTPGVISALRAHLRSFDRESAVPRIVLELSTIPEWAQFFETHPFELFRKPLDFEDASCSHEISRRSVGSE